MRPFGSFDPKDCVDPELAALLESIPDEEAEK